MQNLRWEEWLNRDPSEMKALRRQVEEVAESYTHRSAVAQLRRTRPRGQESSYDGVEFWGNIKNKALLLLALLTRPGSRIAVELDIGLPETKTCQFLREWGVKYLCLPSNTLWVPNNFRDKERPPGYRGFICYEGRVVFKNGLYLLKTATRSYTLRYSQDGVWVFQDEPIPDLTFSHVLYLEDIDLNACNLSTPLFSGFLNETKLIAQLDQESRSLTNNKYGVVPHPQREGDFLVPKEAVAKVYGHQAVECAAEALNPCRCTYWDDERLTCGVDKLRPAPHCEDYHPLDEERAEARSSPQPS